MAGSSLLALLDDIATVLDDVAVMSKAAAKKTAGVLGDDLAVNAEQVSGVRAEREIPVVWAVAKGSMKNKFILVPAALLISVVAPWLITPILMVGGAFLCFEGFEKVLHWFISPAQKQAEHDEITEALTDPSVDMVEFERKKISGAIRTDFILSAEIIAITLGTVSAAPFSTQALVLTVVAILITVGVYGLVAGIVKLDDAGLYLSQREGGGGWLALNRGFGRFLLSAAPYLMKTLTILGTVAMFLVGGGILVHGVPALAEFSHHIPQYLGAQDGHGGFIAGLVKTLFDGVIGITVGALIVPVVNLVMKLMGKSH